MRKMVTAGKIFTLREEVGLKAIAAKLKGYREERIQPLEGGGEVTLLTEISNLTLTADELKGIFSQDNVVDIYQRGKFIQQVKTRETPFVFSSYRGHLLLTVLERKFQANNIANQLSRALFVTSGQIVEAKILPETLKAFHERNPEDTKVIFFDEVDMPNINKLSLYGSSLINTSLYEDYCSHGKIWYLVFKSKKYGYIVGVTRNAIVTIFNNISRDEFMDYVKDEVFPLLSL